MVAPVDYKSGFFPPPRPSVLAPAPPSVVITVPFYMENVINFSSSELLHPSAPVAMEGMAHAGNSDSIRMAIINPRNCIKNISLFISTIKRNLILDDLLITCHVNSNVKYKSPSLV